MKIINDKKKGNDDKYIYKLWLDFIYIAIIFEETCNTCVDGFNG